MMTVDSSTLANNHSAAGGAISSGGALTLTATTISRNSAMYGGGIATQVAPRLVDTIVAGNTLTSSSGSGADIYGSVLAASSYDLIGNGTGLSGISNGVNHNRSAPAANNPMLDPLGNYGGTHPDHAIPTRESRRREGRRRHHADGCRQRHGHGHPRRRRRGLRQHQHPGDHPGR